MNRFEQTSLWQRTLSQQLEPDPYSKERAILRIEFENFRERAKLLAAEISLVLPEFTVHDISHIDALWDTADLVTKDDLDISPTEAFVLGGTFLIHDLGMGLASFPNGVSELKKENIWIDTVTAAIKKKYGRSIIESDLLNLDKDIEKSATENVLRLMHAKHAEKLALISWKDNKDNDLFLIENSELRNSYGSIIGLIAHSHWWPIDELEKKLSATLGAPGIFPSNWSVDPIKLACILRIADATQIDDRRAPSFLRAIRKPSQFSDLHWNFQEKLYQPRLERNRLVYTSKSPFSIDEIESWWICNDTLKMIDKELKDVDSLLVDTNRQRLKATGVASIENAKRLSKLIAVDGWEPVDTQIKVSNVAKLVGSLGGKQLYGDNSIVPLRELIQNSSDAIRARRLIENESDEFGAIVIKTGIDSHGRFIEVEDNGIGMSSNVLTGPFLDFGNSFWGTPLMHEEFPGLESKGFISTGRYGVGFFSVFMWGGKVSITSRRFESGRDKTMVLEFSQGASDRPILRKAHESEFIKDGGTRLKVWLNDGVYEKLLERRNHRYSKVNLAEIIELCCPSLDCTVYLEEKSNTKLIIKANDWLKIPPIELIKRVLGKSYYSKLDIKEKQTLTEAAKNMRIIKEPNGSVVGRLLIYNEPLRLSPDRASLEGIVTVGGMSTSGITGLLGVLIGSSTRASRDIGVPIVSTLTLSEWATEQAKLLNEMGLAERVQIRCASFIRICGGKTDQLKVAVYMKRFITYEEAVNIIKKTNLNRYLILMDGAIKNYEKLNLCEIEEYENIFSVEMGTPSVLQTRDWNSHIFWPDYDLLRKRLFLERSLEGVLIEAFADAWSIDTLTLAKIYHTSNDKDKSEEAVGVVEGREVMIEHVSFIQKPSSNSSSRKLKVIKNQP